MDQIRLLGSGSSGDAALLRCGGSSVLIDAGLSAKRVREGLVRCESSLEALDGVLITHDHTDHVSALRVLLKYRPDLPLYASPGTQQRVGLEADWRTLEAGGSAIVAGFDVHAYRAHHDAVEPLGFRIESRTCGTRIGWATDMGRWDAQTVEYLSDVHFALVESNYDGQMLWGGHYPVRMKHRIDGPMGHLSNMQARDLIEAIASPALRYVALGHLSANNNDPFRALERALEPLRGSEVEVHVAPRKQPSIPFELGQVRTSRSEV